MFNDMYQYSFFGIKDNIRVFNLEFRDKGIMTLLAVVDLSRMPIEGKLHL